MREQSTDLGSVTCTVGDFCDVTGPNGICACSFVFIFTAMAAVAPKIILILQMLGALILIITGVFDRVEADNRPGYMFFPLSYIVMPVWTGVLVSFHVLKFPVTGTCSKTTKHGEFVESNQ